MRIIILGANPIGISLARNLVKEDNDVVLVDEDENALKTIRNRLDIQTLTGAVSSPKTLLKAGITQTDLLIAVTVHDDTNMLACYIAYRLFSVPKTIAKIVNDDYHTYPKLFHRSHIPVQIVINPERLITEYITRIIEYPGIGDLFYFSDDKTCLASIEIQANDWLNGKTIANLKLKLSKINAMVAAVFSSRISVPLADNYTLMVKDKILFFTRKQTLSSLLQTIDRHPRPHKNITIAGGGLIGHNLANCIQDRYHVKLVEKDPKQAAYLAEVLHNVIVLEGDIADRDLLIQENIQNTDLFCAITNDDEANIMSSLQAKFLGARYAVALVNREGYVDLIEESLIDYALAPQNITIGSILSKLRRGNMVKVHRLQEQEIEAIELVIEGTRKTSAVIGRMVSDIEFPPHCLLLGVVRDRELHINTSKLKLMAKDHLILLLLKKKYIRQLEALFQVNLDFMS